MMKNITNIKKNINTCVYNFFKTIYYTLIDPRYAWLVRLIPYILGLCVSAYFNTETSLLMDHTKSDVEYHKEQLDLAKEAKELWLKSNTEPLSASESRL